MAALLGSMLRPRFACSSRSLRCSRAGPVSARPLAASAAPAAAAALEESAGQPHVSVLLSEILDLLKPVDMKVRSSWPCMHLSHARLHC